MYEIYNFILVLEHFSYACEDVSVAHLPGSKTCKKIFFIVCYPVINKSLSFSYQLLAWHWLFFTQLGFVSSVNWGRCWSRNWRHWSNCIGSNWTRLSVKHEATKLRSGNLRQHCNQCFFAVWRVTGGMSRLLETCSACLQMFCFGICPSWRNAS